MSNYSSATIHALGKAELFKVIFRAEQHRLGRRASLLEARAATVGTTPVLRLVQRALEDARGSGTLTRTEKATMNRSWLIPSVSGGAFLAFTLGVAASKSPLDFVGGHAHTGWGAADACAIPARTARRRLGRSHVHPDRFSIEDPGTIARSMAGAPI